MKSLDDIIDAHQKKEPNSYVTTDAAEAYMNEPRRSFAFRAIFGVRQPLMETIDWPIETKTLDNGTQIRRSTGPPVKRTEYDKLIERWHEAFMPVPSYQDENITIYKNPVFRCKCGAPSTHNVCPKCYKKSLDDPTLTPAQRHRISILAGAKLIAQNQSVCIVCNRQAVGGLCDQCRI